MAYRRHVDRHLTPLLDKGCDLDARVREVIRIGVHHEQQHQELVLTDLKHMLSMNPTHPVYRERPAGEAAAGEGTLPLRWIPHAEGLREIGHGGDGFSFDNERPAHRVFLHAFEIGSRPVTNGEYLAFMEEGGYAEPEHWLADGWATVQQRGWQAPLYWEREGGGWRQQTLAGLREIDPDEPVCHVSYYEADAYARSVGARLPGEAEWEIAAREAPIRGNFVERGRLHPAPARPDPGEGALLQAFGDVWEWTGSPYVPYPGFVPPAGALGEYNGKFMSNQMVLRGGSCATPASHIRPSYRNFFYPDARWQFSGIRLARDA
jgi:ergothioneine biosynthesis protein EgtB